MSTASNTTRANLSKLCAGRLESLRDSITEIRMMYAEGWARENNPY